MKRTGVFTLSIVFLTFLITTAAANPNWEIDKAHSNVYFSVDHIFSKVHGHFNNYSVDIVFDPTNPTAGKFLFSIDTNSIDTNIAKRDKHLLSEDFFNATQFPQMSFASTSIKDLGNGQLEVMGTLTVKGVAHDLVLPLTFAGVKDHPAAKGKQVIGFNGEVSLNRLDLGVGNGKFFEMGVVGKDVEVLVSLEALSK